MASIPQDIIDTILSKMKSLASTETVVGEPVKIGEVTAIPIIKISVGFAAGGGEGGGDEEHKSAGFGSGAGGGGGATVTPVGFIVWDGKEVKFIGMGKGKIETLIDTLPDVLRKFGIFRKNEDSKGGKGGKGDKRHSHEHTDEETE